MEKPEGDWGGTCLQFSVVQQEDTHKKSCIPWEILVLNP